MQGKVKGLTVVVVALCAGRFYLIHALMCAIQAWMALNSEGTVQEGVKVNKPDKKQTPPESTLGLTRSVR